MKEYRTKYDVSVIMTDDCAHILHNDMTVVIWILDLIITTDYGNSPDNGAEPNHPDPLSYLVKKINNQLDNYTRISVPAMAKIAWNDIKNHPLILTSQVMKS